MATERFQAPFGDISISGHILIINLNIRLPPEKHIQLILVLPFIKTFMMVALNMETELF